MNVSRQMWRPAWSIGLHKPEKIDPLRRTKAVGGFRYLHSVAHPSFLRD